METTEQSFTGGPILSTLLKFALPVLLALLLQAMYGAVDLQVVGKFGTAADISAVSTGSQIMQTVTIVITGLAMGITVLLGQKIGEGKPEEAGQAVGSGICLFLVVAVVATAALELAAPQLAVLMHAPADAFDGTVEYVRICSAGVGVAEKLCAFVMLVPSAYMQSMSAFVAQNIGAGLEDRARRALLYGVLSSLVAGLIMGWAAFFHGDVLAGIFADDRAVIAAAWEYLKAYAIDCLLTSFLFCFVGFFNGCGQTLFVMVQGMIGALCVRLPVALLVSWSADSSLFHLGLATPASTTVQIILCGIWFLRHVRRQKRLALQQ